MSIDLLKVIPKKISLNLRLALSPRHRVYYASRWPEEQGSKDLYVIPRSLCIQLGGQAGAEVEESFTSLAAGPVETGAAEAGSPF